MTAREALLALWDLYGGECEHGRGFDGNCSRCSDEQPLLNDVRGALRAAALEAGAERVRELVRADEVPLVEVTRADGSTQRGVVVTVMGDAWYVEYADGECHEVPLRDLVAVEVIDA